MYFIDFIKLIIHSYFQILERQNNVFELITVAPIQDVEPLYGLEDEDDIGVSLKLKGHYLILSFKPQLICSWHLQINAHYGFSLSCLFPATSAQTFYIEK